MDHYFVKSDDTAGFDAVLKDRFPGLSEKKKPDLEVLRKDLRIMVAENNSLSQTVAHLVFKNLGYEVDFAQNALELIREMNKNTYDIIFIDLKFPPTDGFRIAEVLRGKEYKLPIIAMTSTQTKENLKNISDSGMNGYVAKPLNPESIRNVLLNRFV
jgi:CheY-like chemotaxis protein